MCGIAGIISFKQPVQQEKLKSMTDVIRHREISIFVKRNAIVTVHEGSIAALQVVERRFREQKLATTGLVLHAILDTIAALPQVAASGKQFFLAWGQWRGDEIRPETQRTMVQGDPHPIAKFRVNGPLSNLPEFQQAFACKAGAPMVREGKDRCEVW